MSKFIKILRDTIIVFIIVIITDIVIFFFTPSSIKASLFVNRAHRIKSFYYHHDFRKNAYFFDQWGYEKYQVFTNNLGFKDHSNREITFKDKNILFIGDSFTEGVGLKFEDTYVGLISKKLNDNKTQVLNAGVQSYSPKIYFAKLYDIIHRNEYPITHVIVMISGGDIYDDYYKYKEVNDKNILLHDDFQNKYIIEIINFFKSHTFLYQLITRITPPKVIPELISSLFQKKKEFTNYSDKEFELKKMKEEEIFKFKFLQNPDYEYLFNDEKFLSWGKEGIINSSKYINKIALMLKQKNIKLDVLYAQDAPLLLINPIEKNLNFLLETIKDSTVNYSGKFHYIKDFTLSYPDAIEAYKNLYFIGDHHYNKKGNQEVAKEILKKVKF